MKKIAGHVFLFVVIGLLAVPMSSSADEQRSEQNFLLAQTGGQEGQTPSPTPSDAWISNGKELGPWWTKGTYDFDPLPRPLLYHVEVNFNFLKMTGNLEHETYGLGSGVMLRKHRFTNRFAYTWNESETSQGGATIESKDLHWENFFNADLSKYHYIVAGATWDYSKDRDIDSDLMYFAGLGGQVLQTPKYQLGILGAYGKIKTESISDPDNEREFDALYFRETFGWVISPTVSLNQSFEHRQNIDDTDDYECTLMAGLNFKVFGPLSVNTTYMVKYDNEPLPGASDDTDTRLTAGIGLSF